MAQVGSEAVVGESTTPDGGEPTQGVVGRSPTELFWRRLRQDRYAIAGATFIVLLTVVAIGAGLIVKFVTHHPPDALYLYRGTTENGLPRGPDPNFWFGFDTVGRDLFIRVLYGARTSLIVAIVATGLSVVIGVLLGMAAGFYRGWVDTLVSRTIDIMMSLPILLLALGLAAVCSATAKGCLGGFITPGLKLVILIIAFVNWTYIARIVRGQVLSLREKEFVESSYATGASDWRIMTKELLPNLAMPIIVYSTLVIPNNILFEAALSFLGVGVDPNTPSWGRMISEAAGNGIYTVAWWYMLFPGLFLFLITFAFNLLGDGLRDALDPRTAK